MTIPNSLGSTAVSELLSLSPSTATEIGIAAAVGVGVVAVGATIGVAWYEFEEHKKKERLEEIEKIVDLQERYLTNIKVQGTSEYLNLLPIVKYNGKKGENPQILLPADMDIEKFDSPAGMVPDTSLLNYRQKVKSAIIKMRAYYKERVTEHGKTDLTACVLRNLIYTLESKAMHFQGREYDVAVIEAIKTFACQWVSMHGENSQHATHMKEALAFLGAARESLGHHKELFYLKGNQHPLTLEEAIQQLLTTCEIESTNLIKIFIKLVTESKHWELIENVVIEDLVEGMLREKTTEIRLFKKLPVWYSREKDLPSSIFQIWIKSLSNYYLQVIQKNVSDGAYLSLESIFALPNVSMLSAQKQHPFAKETKDTENLLQHIRHVFKHSKNFFTMKISDNKETNVSKLRLASIHKDEDIIIKAAQLREFALLIFKVISLLHLCIKLLDSGKWLGEMDEEISDNDFNRVFAVLDGLGNQIKEDTKKIEKYVNDIPQKHKDLLFGEQDLFLKEVNNQLASMKTIISWLHKAKRCREAFAEQLKEMHLTSDDVKQSVKRDLLNTADTLATTYHIHLSPPKNTPAKKTDMPAIKADPAAAPISEKPQEQPQISVSVLLDDIADRIKTIQAKEKPLTDAEIKAYETLRKELIAIQIKSQSMTAENNKSEKRSQKALALAQLVHILCEQTKTFLSLNQENRKQQVQSFYQLMHQELSKPKNSIWLDWHKRPISQLFIPTQTRKIANRVDAACAEINHLLNSPTAVSLVKNTEMGIP